MLTFVELFEVLWKPTWSLYLGIFLLEDMTKMSQQHDYQWVYRSRRWWLLRWIAIMNQVVQVAKLPAGTAINLLAAPISGSIYHRCGFFDEDCNHKQHHGRVQSRSQKVRQLNIFDDQRLYLKCYPNYSPTNCHGYEHEMRYSIVTDNEKINPMAVEMNISWITTDKP